MAHRKCATARLRPLRPRGPGRESCRTSNPIHARSARGAQSARDIGPTIPSGHDPYWQAGSYSVTLDLERLIQHDGLHAVRPGRDHIDGDIADFGNALKIAA